jgi:hypothetical protein
VTAQLSEEATKEALRKLSWKALADHLRTVLLDAGDVEKLLGLVKRCEALVQKRHDPQREATRDKLLSELAAFLDAKSFGAAAESMRSYTAMFRRVEGCYQGILSELKKCVAAEFCPEKRVAALMGRSAREYIDLVQRLHAAAADRTAQAGNATLKNDEGREFNVLAAHTAIVETLGSTILMEAYSGEWFDGDGAVVLPSFPETTEHDQFVVGSVQLLAASWRSWQRAEQRHRYLEGALDEFHDELPAWAPPTSKRAFEFAPSVEHELLDFVANERLFARLNHEFLRMTFDNGVRSIVVGIAGSAALIPEQAVSISELHGAAALSQLLSSAIARDTQEYGGLRLVEWMRGYAVLQCVAEQNRDLSRPESTCVRLSRSDLEGLLQQLGLDEQKASTFVDRATFRRESRDLFDQPLVRLPDNNFVLVGAAIENALLPRVVLSTLGMLKVNLDGRGKAFERYIIKFLQEHGFDAKGFRCSRGGEEYDYDAAFVWGDYLFLLECKSRSLSGHDPVATYYFSLGTSSVVAQAKRLAEGLRRHPDILQQHMPEAIGKKVVSCVVNSLPFAIPDGIDGIFFTDESSFTRFFRQPTFGARRLDAEGGWKALEPDDVMASLWSGPEPTAEDLLRHLAKPIQVFIHASHTTMSPAWAVLGDGTVGMLQELSLRDMTVDSMRSALEEFGFASHEG